MTQDAPHRRPHAVLDLPSRRLKALKIERLLQLRRRRGPINLLEIGTGSGGIAHYFATHASLRCNVVAVDLVDQRVVSVGYSFQKIAGTSLPFIDGVFDVVITNHVIEHTGVLPEQRHHLQEVRRVMGVDGVAYLAVPNRWMLIEPHYRLAFLSWLPQSLRSPYVRLMRRGSYYDCEPLPASTLERLFREAGLAYKNLCTPALRETLSLEGTQSVAAAFVAKFPDRLLERLTPIFPTLIYRLQHKTWNRE